MSRGRAIEAGQAAVRFIGDRSPLQQALRLAEQDLRAFGATVGSIGRSLTVASLATASAFAVPVRDAIELVDTLGDMDAAFGSVASTARGFLAPLQKELGLSQKTAATTLAEFQRFFRGMEVGEKDSAKLADQFTRMAADLEAATSVDFEGAVGALRTGLAGSERAVRQFGVNLDKSLVEAKAFSMGIKKTASELTDYERTVVHAALITEQLSARGVLGDAKNSAGEAEGAIKRLKGTLADLSATIGTAILPVIQPMLTQLRDAATATSEWVGANEEILQNIAMVVPAVASLGLVMQATSIAANALATNIKVVSVSLAFLSKHPLVAIAAALASVAVYLIAQSKSWEEWRDVASRAVQFVGSGLVKVLDTLAGISREFDEAVGIIPANQFAPVTPEQRRLNAMTPLQREELANSRGRAQSENEILETRRKMAREMRGRLPEHVVAGYGLGHFEVGLSNIFKVIGKTLQDDLGAAGAVFKADLTVAKGLAADIAQSGRKYLEESKLLLMQKRLKELAKQTFRFEVATSFRHGALREAFGIGTGDVDEQQLEVQKEMRSLLRKIEAKKSAIAVM